MILEIYTDASIRMIEGIPFGSAGAVCAQINKEYFSVLADTTNNRSELIAIYNGLVLARDIMRSNPNYDRVVLYSDSKISIYGLTTWLSYWTTHKRNNHWYNSSGAMVKNQELYECILSFIEINKINVTFRHISGHVNYTNPLAVYKANDVYNKSNGKYLAPIDVCKTQYYNDYVDNKSRKLLGFVNHFYYPKLSDGVEMIKYDVSGVYKNLISH